MNPKEFISKYNMDDDCVVHVEVYIKDYTYPSYEIKDDDQDIRFSSFLFPDCLAEFYLNDDKPLEIPLQQIEEGYKNLKNAILLVPIHVTYKIESLIDYLRKNSVFKIRTIF